MLREFKVLNEAETSLILDAIPLITMLVAGADGNMDKEELASAEKMTKVRSYDFNSQLKDYFKRVGEQFSDRLEKYNTELPKDTDERIQAIAELLASLNPILHKMDDFDAAVYYKNFRSFAKHVAEASGGFMRFMTIGPKEADVVELPMLDVFE